jgi:hypothetical protein
MSLNLPYIFNLFMFVLVSADEFYYTSHGEDPIINGGLSDMFYLSKSRSVR